MKQSLIHAAVRRLRSTLWGLFALCLGLMAVTPLLAREPTAPTAPTMSVTKTDSLLVDSDNDTRADPGDTIRYDVVLRNLGSSDATGVAFSDTIDPLTTLVGGSVKVSPLARNDAYTTVGNTLLAVGTPSTAPHVAVSGSLFANDTDFAGDSCCTLDVFDATSIQGGTVSVNGDGTFTYLPPAGFTGSDTFTYRLIDTSGLTGTATVTITVASRVWYINSAAAVNGNGRSTSPFNTLAAVQGAGDPDAAGDVIYLFSSATNYSDGITLEANQQLIGGGVALVVNTLTLHPAGTKPTIVNLTASSAGAGVNLATNNTISGVIIGNTTQAGINGTSFGTLNVTSTIINGTGRIVTLDTGTVNASFESLSTTSAATAISLNAVGGTLTSPTTTISGVATGIGIQSSVSGSNFDFGATSISATTVGINLANNTGSTIRLSNPTISVSNGSGLTAIGGGTIAISGSSGTIDATNGAAINATGMTFTASTLASASSTTSTISGIALGTMSGSLTINAGSITNPAANGIIVDGGTGTVTYAGSISLSTAGTRSVVVQNRSSGSVTLSGNITDNRQGMLVQTNTGGTVTLSGSTKTFSTGSAAAVTLLNNTGATVNFTNGGLNITTTTGRGFDVSGGGTVAVTGSVNRIASGNNTALSIVSTTIGASGVTFERISASNVSNGIVLTSTGAGAFTVTGVGTTDGSGGTIQTTTRGVNISNASSVTLKNMQFLNAANTDGASLCDGLTNVGCNGAVTLLSTTNVVLDNLDISGTMQEGINANNVTNLAIQNSTLTGCGNAVNEGCLRFGELKGTVTISSSSFSLSAERNAWIQNASGSLNLSITGSTFDNTVASSVGADNLEINLHGTATADINVVNNSFTRYKTRGLEVITEDTATATVDVTGNTFNPQNTNGIAIKLASIETSSLQFNISNNPLIAGYNGSAIILNALDQASFQGRIRDNPNIRVDAGTNNVINVDVTDSGTGKLEIHNNTVTAVVNGDPIVASIFDDLTVGTSRLDVTITNNQVSHTTTPPALNSAIRLGALEGHTICGDVRNNNVTGTTSGTGDYVFRVRAVDPSSKVELEGFNTNAATTWANNGNTPANATLVSQGGSGTFASGICAMPTNPLPRPAVDPTALVDVMALTTLPAEVQAAANEQQTEQLTGQTSAIVAPVVRVGRRAPVVPDATQPVELEAAQALEPLAEPQAIESGETINVAIGTLGPNEQVLIRFDVTIGSVIPAGKEFISNQAVVTGSNFAQVSSDDPDTGTVGDPTLTPLDAAPDLALTKSDGAITVSPGGTVAYTLNFVNNGTQAASGVVLTETVPANSSFNPGASTAGWVCAPNNNAGSTCTLAVGGLISGANGSATFAVTVVNPVAAGVNEISNSATIADDNASGADLNPSNNTATDTTPVDAAPDLSITKSDGGVSGTPGGTVAYTLAYTNTGNQGAAGVVLTETVPANSSFNSGASTVGWVCAPNNNAGSTCTFPVGGLMAGTSGSAIFAVTVASSFPIGVNEITNTATIADDAANGGDPTPGNNSGSDTTPIDADPDLSISKTDEGATAVPGGTVAYTLAIANNGYRDASNVVITDTVPLHTTFVAASSTAGWSCSDGAVAGTVCLFNLASLPVGGTGSVTFAVQVTATVPSGVSEITNTAAIGDDGTSGTDLDPSNNSDTESTPLNANPDLSLTKDDGVDSVMPGQTTVYTLTVSNQGNQDAAGVVLSETVPTNTTFNAGASSAGWLCTPDSNAGSTCTLLVGNLAAGASQPRLFAVTVINPVAAGASQISNTASTDDDHNNGADPTPANNQDTDTDTLIATPDLRVGKSDGGISAVPGQTVAYTLIYTNTGNQGATGVVLTETVPANSTFNPGASTAGWVCTPDGNAGSTCTLTVGAVAGGNTSNSAIFAVTAASSFPIGVNEITNTVTIVDDESNGVDPTPGNNSGSDTTPINAEPDLSINKTDEGATAVPGGTVAYTLAIVNNGYRDASNVVITETVPVHTTFNAGLSSAGWSCSDGSGAGTVCVYAYGSLAVGASNSLTFAVNVIAPAAAGATEISNTASIGDDGAGGADPDLSDNTATETTPINAAPDITITKDDGVTSVVPGQTTVYTLTVSNTGNQNATGVVITETVPLHTTFNAAASSAGWSCSDGAPAGTTCLLTVGNLTAETNATRLFAVSVVNPAPSGANQISNTANAADDGTNGADPTPANNQDTDTDTLNAAADLVLTKTDGGITAVPGQTVAYTLTVTNAGNQVASGVGLTEIVPANTAFNAAGSSAGWSCADGAPAGTTCTFNVGVLTTTASARFAVTVANPAPANVTQIVNTASVADDGNNGADPTPANNSATDTTPLQITLDVAISKQANPTLVGNGTPIQYTIRFTVTGNTIINNLRITDTLPTEFSFGSVSYAGLALTEVSGAPNFVWQANAVNPGATGTITLNGTANVPTNSEVTFTNTAQIGHWQDTTSANNSGSAVIESNLAPTANAGGPYIVSEGSTLTLSAAGSSDPGNDIVSYEWDFDSDGQYDDAIGVAPPFTNTADGPASFAIALRVTDDNGATAVATGSVTVNNVAPTVNAGPDRVGNPNQAISFTGIFTDPGTLDTHTIAWDFGDGGSATGTLNPSHSYLTAGVYTVSLTVTDKDGGTSTDTLIVNVTRYGLYLPFLAKPHPRPDLIVESVTLSPNDITVVIRNVGNLAVTDPFWVDLYLDPKPEPKRVNQIWMMLSEHGAAWGVGSSEFFINPGASVTLHLGDQYFDAGQSDLPATIPVGTKVFVQVDSANAGVSYGAVLESHEELNLPYNNIIGPVTTTAPIVPPVLRSPLPAPDGELPRRLEGVLPSREN